MNNTDKVIAIIAKELDIDPKSISVTDTFDDLGVDSLTGIEIVLAVEKAFGKELSPDSPPPKTVQDVIDFIESID